MIKLIVQKAGFAPRVFERDAEPNRQDDSVINLVVSTDGHLLRKVFGDQKTVDAYLQITLPRLVDMHRVDPAMTLTADEAREYAFTSEDDLGLIDTIRKEYLEAISPLIIGASGETLSNLAKRRSWVATLTYALSAFLKRPDANLQIYSEIYFKTLKVFGHAVARDALDFSILENPTESLTRVARHAELIGPIVKAHQRAIQNNLIKRELPVKFLEAIVHESELEISANKQITSTVDIKGIFLSYAKLMPKEMAEWVGGTVSELPTNINEYIQKQSFTPLTLKEIEKLPVSVNSIRPLLNTRDGALFVMENILTRPEWATIEGLAPLEYWIAAAPLNDASKAQELDEQYFKVYPALRKHPELLSHVWDGKVPAKPKPLTGIQVIESYRDKGWAHSQVQGLLDEPKDNMTCWQLLTQRI